MPGEEIHISIDRIGAVEEAIFVHDEAVNRLVVQEVAFNDLGQVVRGDLSVYGVTGVDDDQRSLVTKTQTARKDYACPVGYAGGLDPSLQFFAQIARPAFQAGLLFTYRYSLRCNCCLRAQNQDDDSANCPVVNDLAQYQMPPDYFPGLFNRDAAVLNRDAVRFNYLDHGFKIAQSRTALGA